MLALNNFVANRKVWQCYTFKYAIITLEQKDVKTFHFQDL